MSLVGTLFTGVSGLSAQSKALSITSNNIANVNTVGYKKGQSSFTTILAGSGSSTGGTASGGVQTNTVNRVDEQGLIQASGSGTDLAIEGAGFFAVTALPDDAPDISELAFTRAGSFTKDELGYLRNASGYYLQGWRLDSTGAIPTDRSDVEAVNVDQFTGTAEPSTTFSMRANLQASETTFGGTYAAGTVANNMASGNVTPNFQRTIEIYDSQGGAQPFTLAFLKTGTNQWNYELIYEGAAANITTGAGLPVANGTVTFSSDGTILTPNVSGDAEWSATIPWSAASGLSSQTMTFDFGPVGEPAGLTQYDGESTIISSVVDGSLYGYLSGVSIDEDGVVYALFDNGAQEAVYQLPIANFSNANGLQALSQNAYIATFESGAATLLEASIGGAGSVSAGSLEASTVDLAKEFTDLITTQRAYSAATKIITTADDMLEEMIRVKR